MNASVLQAQLSEQRMKVDFNTYDLSLKEIVGMVTDSIINISPEYQRRFRWDPERQSSLVESLFLGIPVPTVFMATNADGTWELIDGVQRISTIINFMGTEEDRKVLNSSTVKAGLVLTGLEKLNAFNDMSFLQLPMDIQLKFKLSSLKVTTLTDKSDLNVRFDLFERLNRGGITLSDQEIRSCVYHGRFNDFIKELAQDANFVQCVHVSDNKADSGLREELVLRAFAYLYDIDSFDHSVKDFLNEYMKKANKRFDYKRSEDAFRSVFKILNQSLPNGISKGRNSTPLNLYEAVAVGALKVYLKKQSINVDNIETWLKDPELIRFTTGATNSKPRVIGRIAFCEEKFGA